MLSKASLKIADISKVMTKGNSPDLFSVSVAMLVKGCKVLIKNASKKCFM